MPSAVPAITERDALFKTFGRAFFKRDLDLMNQVVTPDFVWAALAPDGGVKAKIDEIEQQMVGDNAFAASVDIPAFSAARAFCAAEAGLHRALVLVDGVEAGDQVAAQALEIRKVLGLAGISALSITNIEEAFAALTFPEPAPEPEAVDSAVAVELVAESAPEAEMTPEENQAERKKDAKRVVEHDKDFKPPLKWADDPHYQAELDRRLANMDAGKKSGPTDLDRLHANLSRQGK